MCGAVGAGVVGADVGARVGDVVGAGVWALEASLVALKVGFVQTVQLYR